LAGHYVGIRLVRRSPVAAPLSAGPAGLRPGFAGQTNAGHPASCASSAGLLAPGPDTGGPAPAGDLTGADGSRPAPAGGVYRKLILEKIPLLALAAISCLITMVVQADTGAVMSLAIRPMGPQIANALAAYVEYIVKLFWPYPMVFFYPLVPVVWWQAAGAGLALLALSTFLLYRARRYPYLAVGWFWYLGTVAPVIGLVQVGGQAIADRYTYIPFIGLFIMVAWGVSEVSAGWRHRQVIAATGILSAILACVLSTWVQVGYWRNSETLFNHALQIDRNNYMAYHHLGMAMANEGKTDKAIAMYRKTLAVAPKYWPAYNNLGIICAKQGRFDEAVSLFKAAIALTPTNVDVYRNLARAYGNQGKKSEAEAVMAHVKWLIGNRGFRY